MLEGCCQDLLREVIQLSRAGSPVGASEDERTEIDQFLKKKGASEHETNEIDQFSFDQFSSEDERSEIDQFSFWDHLEFGSTDSAFSELDDFDEDEKMDATPLPSYRDTYYMDAPQAAMVKKLYITQSYSNLPPLQPIAHKQISHAPLLSPSYSTPSHPPTPLLSPSYTTSSHPPTPSSHFDTYNFPCTITDAYRMTNLETTEDPTTGETVSLTFDLPDEAKVLEPEDTENVPVIHVTQAPNEPQPHVTPLMTNRLDPNHRRTRKPNRRYSSSSSSETDEEWHPKKSSRRRSAPYTTNHRRRRHSSQSTTSNNNDAIPTPTPQRRAPGTKLKITQWIVTLLHSPEFNPSVITWVDEPKGLFRIVDTKRYAELWGQVKQNDNMTYEKLSRAMRYSYRNNELEVVAGKRLTYKFGHNMLDWRAPNNKDPNFDQVHGTSNLIQTNVVQDCGLYY